MISRLARLLPPTMLLIAPAAAGAATRSTTGQASVLSPLSVIKNADLNFGTLVVSGTGTAVVDPVSGTETTTGGVVSSGTAEHPARFTGTGSKNSVVHIRVPTTPITVTRVGGTETMTVTNWTTDAPTNLKVPPSQTFTFSVGGTLNVGAGQVPGTYIGTFNVTVQYP